MSPRNRRLVFGGVLPLVSALVAAGAILAASLASFGAWPARANKKLEAPTAMEIAATLRRAGITPESLAAVGATDQQVTALAAGAVAYLDAQRFAALEQADETVRTAEAHRNELARRVQGGGGSQEDVAALRTAESNLADALAARAALIDGACEAVRGQLGQQQVATLSQIRANDAWDLPLQYRVVGRSAAEWVALRNALANLRVNPLFDEDVDSGCQSLVTQCDAQPEVAAAKSSLDTRLGPVTAAFEQALGLEG